MDSKGSVTHWVRDLKHGDDAEAQQQIWNRYFSRLMNVARHRLRCVSRRVEDEEDVAVCALASFFQRARDGRFPQLHDRTDLWPLLVRITARKACRLIEKQRAQKRGNGDVRGDSAFDLRPGGLASIEDVVGNEPTPEFSAALVDETQRLFGCLDEPILQQIADEKLQGYTNGEIARKHGISERTVERKLRRIRVFWQEVSES